MARQELPDTVLALLAQCHEDYNSTAAVQIRANMSRRQQLELAREAAAKHNAAQRKRRESK